MANEDLMLAQLIGNALALQDYTRHKFESCVEWCSCGLKATYEQVAASNLEYLNNGSSGDIIDQINLSANEPDIPRT